MPDFVYRILPGRPDFVATITEAERAVMGAHFAYLQDLHAKGCIRFVGRTEAGEYGIIVFSAVDIEAARATAIADPAVAVGVVTAEVHPFRIVDFG